MAREIPHPHLYIEFYLDAVKDKRASRDEGRPIFKDVEMIYIRIVGDPTRDLRAPAHEKFIQAPKGWRTPAGGRYVGFDDDDDNNARPQLTYAEYYHEHYAVFQEMNQKAEVGTPIEMLSFLGKRRQAELKAREVRTVEGLAQLPDRLLKDCGPSTRAERDQAKAWLDQSDQAALVAASREREDTLEARLAEMQAKIDAMDKPTAQQLGAGSLIKTDDPGTWDEDDLRGFIVSKGLPNPRSNASHDKLVAAARDLLVDELTVDEDAE